MIHSKDKVEENHKNISIAHPVSLLPAQHPEPRPLPLADPASSARPPMSTEVQVQKANLHVITIYLENVGTTVNVSYP